MAYGFGYLVVAIFALVGVIFVAAALLLARALRPSAPHPAKLETYECGPTPELPAWHQFPVRYYIFALLFVLFDVEAVFLFPWALGYRQLGTLGVLEAAIFLAILALGLAYAWRKDALKWE